MLTKGFLVSGFGNVHSHLMSLGILLKMFSAPSDKGTRLALPDLLMGMRQMSDVSMCEKSECIKLCQQQQIQLDKFYKRIA